MQLRRIKQIALWLNKNIYNPKGTLLSFNLGGFSSLLSLSREFEVNSPVILHEVAGTIKAIDPATPRRMTKKGSLQPHIFLGAVLQRHDDV